MSNPLHRFLQCHHGEGILLVLVLVEVRRSKIADAIGAGDATAERLARIVGDLEVACGVTEDRTHPGLWIQNRRRITEEVALVGPVVDRAVAVGRIFDAEIAGEAAAREEIFRAASTATVFEAR